MSLSVRLSIALAIAALVLFAGAGAWQLRSEEADLRRSVRRDLRLLGRSLQVSFENALRDRQAEDVQETLSGLESIAPNVDVFVYDARGALLAASRGASERPRWMAARPERTELHFIERDEGSGHVELLVPLRITREEREATLVIVRPLDDMMADLRATRVRVATSVFAFVVLVALLTQFLARFWVGAPLGRMIEQMRRVRGGDLSSTPTEERGDEVGLTLAEFHALVDELRAARERLETEGEARRRLETELREVDKLRAVGMLAAGLAHEIGSPLQVLAGRIRGLEPRADDPTEVRRTATILLEQTERITRIVARLMTLARRRTRHVEAVEADAPVRAVVELMESEARRRGIALTLTTGDAPMVNADSDELQQVTLNLVRNALDACARGGCVSVDVDRGELQSVLGAPVAAVRITVEDDGHGMEDAVRERALEPFFTTRTESGGTGLGLAVVKSIVDDLGGRLAIESRLHHGTKLTVLLPSREVTR